MADKIAQQLRTNVERLGARLSENLAEHSRDLGLVDSFASGSGGGAGRYLESGAVLTAAGIEETKRMLASKREGERTEGLKRVIAMMTKNLPVTSFFPLVTSLLSPTTPLQSRSLISLYIIHCASTAPELALLSINAYQKDLSDPNPLVRAGAITTLSRMELSDIRELVGLAIQKGCRDTSWYVRRATADALRSLWRADRTKENLESLTPTLKVLLDSATPLTVGATVEAWEESTAGEGWELLHGNFRRFAKELLMDTEEWGQTTLLRMFTRYGRNFFLDPVKTGRLDPDAELVLKCATPLLNHLNPAVVSAVIKLHYYIGLPDRQSRIVKPLLRLLHGSPEIASAALEECALIVEQRPDLFIDHLSSFFVKFSDPPESRRTRLRIIVALTNESNIRIVLGELLTYVKDIDDSFSSSAVHAIGTCAQRVPAVSGECLKTLIKLLSSKHESTIVSSILVLRSLLLSTSLPTTTSRTSIITRLVSQLHSGQIRDPTAKSTVYWLVGQSVADEGGKLLRDGCAADVVRLGAKNFHQEAIPSKLQLLTLSAKTLITSYLSPLTPHLRPLSLLFTYLTTLARYDLAYEVRDRARFLSGLLDSAGIGKGGNGNERGEAKVMLDEEEFKRGVSVEEFTASQGGEKQEDKGEGRTLRAEDVRRILFDGKSFDSSSQNDPSNYGDRPLGSFSLLLGYSSSKRPFSPSSSILTSIPPYPTSVPPSSIRTPTTPQSGTISSNRGMPGFGSDSVRAISSTEFNRRGGGPSMGGGGGRREKVVLVPTMSSSMRESGDIYRGSGSGGGRRKKEDLEEFFRDEESESEEESSEEEEEEEEDGEGSTEEEESEEGDSEEESSEEDSEHRR
ncbi:uncharacterized protein JCM6883_001765 [Sporobolomyces salmoneus]|uniref:uncharacterized protein n=1 Tax=Sporobolomyces salmoneus TaxID=183962 RepID=UPI00316EC96B